MERYGRRACVHSEGNRVSRPAGRLTRIETELVPGQLQLALDQLLPDQLLPDQLLPDQLLPDQLLPFHTPPDQLLPAEALDKLGEGRQAFDIAVGWVRAKLAPSAVAAGEPAAESAPVDA